MPPPPPPPLTRVLRPALLLLAVGAFHAALAAPTSLPAATSSTVILMSDTHRPLPLPSKTAKLHFHTAAQSTRLLAGDRSESRSLNGSRNERRYQW